MRRPYLMLLLLFPSFGYEICLVRGFAVSPDLAVERNGKSSPGPGVEKSQDHNVKTGETNALIVPGRSVGPLHLGDPESKFYALFPGGPNMDIQPPHNPDCGTQLQWVDLDESHPSV